MIENKYIQKAEDELEYLTGDAKIRRLVEIRENALRDEQAALAATKREGIKEGLKLGIEQGKKEKEKELAKKMLAEKIEIETIEKVTGLTKEEIESL